MLVGFPFTKPEARGGECHESDANSPSHTGKRRDPRGRRRRDRERSELERDRDDAKHNDPERNYTGGLVNDTVARQREPELPGHVARQMRAAPAFLTVPHVCRD
jgi:hypothetical protein